MGRFGPADPPQIHQAPLPRRGLPSQSALQINPMSFPNIYFIYTCLSTIFILFYSSLLIASSPLINRPTLENTSAALPIAPSLLLRRSCCRLRRPPHFQPTFFLLFLTFFSFPPRLALRSPPNPSRTLNPSASILILPLLACGFLSLSYLLALQTLFNECILRIFVDRYRQQWANQWKKDNSCLN